MENCINWETDGHCYSLEVIPTSTDGLLRCYVSEYDSDFWEEDFFVHGKDPMAEALDLIRRHNNQNAEAFRLAEYRYGKEAVRLVRQEVGDESARIYFEGRQIYILTVHDYAEVRAYYALEYKHELGIDPTEEDLTDYIDYNYHLIPCSEGYVVITPDYNFPHI